MFDTFKMWCLIYRSALYNLQTRKVWNSTKPQIELSINSNTKGLKYKRMLMFLEISKICSMIQRLDSCNLLTNKKRLKKWLEQLTDPMKKKAKKVLESTWTILKVLKYKPCLSFWGCQKKIVGFTYSTHIIY